MLTPGVGYSITNSPKGYSLEIEQQTQVIDTPFRVYEDSTSNGTAIIRISPGTINNVLPTVGGSQIGGASAYLAKPQSSGFVILSIPASATPGSAFPSGTPQVTFNATVQASSAEMAFVALASITAISQDGSTILTINQLVTGSLWGERFECGEELDYWFSRI